MKKKYITVFLLAIIIPSFLANIITSILYARYMTARIEKSYEYACKINNENAKDTFRDIENILNRIASNRDIKESIKKLEVAENTNQSLKYSRDIDSEIDGIIYSDDNSNENLYTITIYPMEEAAVCIGNHVSSVNNININSWYKDIKADRQFIYANSRFGRDVLGVVKYIYDGDSFLEFDRKIALVIIEIEASKFLKNMINLLNTINFKFLI